MGVRRVAELDSHLSSSGFPGELEVLHLSCCFVSACNVPGPLGERFGRLRSYLLPECKFPKAVIPRQRKMRCQGTKVK